VIQYSEGSVGGGIVSRTPTTGPPEETDDPLYADRRGLRPGLIKSTQSQYSPRNNTRLAITAPPTPSTKNKYAPPPIKAKAQIKLIVRRTGPILFMSPILFIVAWVVLSGRHSTILCDGGHSLGAILHVNPHVWVRKLS
jgi:hypothetical protein